MKAATATAGSIAWQRAAAGLVVRPDRDTIVAFVSYLAVVATIYLAFQVFTTERVAANFITYGIVGLAGLGVAFPVFYTVLVRRRPLRDLGLEATYGFVVVLVLMGVAITAGSVMSSRRTMLSTAQR